LRAGAGGSTLNSVLRLPRDRLEEAVVSEKDLATFRRIPLEMFNEGRVELVDELFTDDYVEHAALPPGVPDGKASVPAFIQGLRAAFPDFQYTVLHDMSDGATYAAHVQATGTMTGDFMGMPATGKTATWEEGHFGLIRDGKLSEHWVIVDQLGMLTQLGLAPAAG
jgi:steroid delta-isomerase-like uncharacterized protein